MNNIYQILDEKLSSKKLNSVLPLHILPFQILLQSVTMFERIL